MRMSVLPASKKIARGRARSEGIASRYTVVSVTALGLVFRWLHLLVSLALVGAAVAPLLAGRSDRATARAWEASTIVVARLLAAAAVVSGLGVFALHVITLEGRPDALTDADALARVLLDTRTGLVLGLRL